MTPIDILITAWPNHPARFDGLRRTLDALDRYLSTGSFAAALTIYAESARDPRHPWMGEQLQTLCADRRLALRWNEGPPSLPEQLNRLHGESRADLRFYVQDDWLLNRPLSLAPAAELLLADPLLAGVRFWANTGYLPLGSEAPWRVVDPAAPWAYGDNPALWNRRFFDLCGPFATDGDFGTHELRMCETIRRGPLKILAAAEVPDSPSYYFSHVRGISSLPNETRYPESDRNRQP